MKLLIDLTEEELVNISPEEKQQVYLLELAERGIALPSAVPEYIPSPDARDDLQPDTTVYSIGADSYGSSNYYFATIEEAQAAAALVSSSRIKVDYNYNAGSGRTYYITSQDASEIEIQTTPAFSMDLYNKLKGELKEYNVKKANIDKQNGRRKDILDKQAVVMAEIDDAIAEANRKVTRVNEFAAMYAEYLKMANDDADVAARFLLNAHYDELHEYEDVYLQRIGISLKTINDYETKSFGNVEES